MEGMAPLCWEVEGCVCTLWLRTMVCRLDVTFVIAVQKTACWGDSEPMGSELKLKLSLNCGLEYSKTSVWVVGGAGGAGGTQRIGGEGYWFHWSVLKSYTKLFRFKKCEVTLCVWIKLFILFRTSNCVREIFG